MCPGSEGRLELARAHAGGQGPSRARLVVRRARRHERLPKPGRPPDRLGTLLRLPYSSKRAARRCSRSLASLARIILSLSNSIRFSAASFSARARSALSAFALFCLTADLTVAFFFGFCVRVAGTRVCRRDMPVVEQGTPSLSSCASTCLVTNPSATRRPHLRQIRAEGGVETMTLLITWGNRICEGPI